MVGLEEALEIWEMHLKSIRESFQSFGEYSLPECWISEEIVKGLEEGFERIQKELTDD